jgi:hypothetical protein
MNSAMIPTPNQALQRTAPGVTAPASVTAFPPAIQMPRRPPESLSLRSFGVSSRTVKMTLGAALLLIGLAHSGIGAVTESCSASLHFLGSSPAMSRQHDYRFSFTNRFSHSVYYLVHRQDVVPIAGQPFHYESFRRWGRWSSPEYQFRDVRLDFRRVRPGQTAAFVITRSRSFWPWCLTIAFYARPDYQALSGEVSSDPIPQ